MTIRSERKNPERPSRRWLRVVVATTISVVAAFLALVGTAQAQPNPAHRQAPATAYGYADMMSYYDSVIAMVEGYSTQTYASMPQPGYVYISAGTQAQTACGAMDSRAFAYCGADATVYIGQDELWLFYSKVGDAGAAFGIAHEWGHHVQNVAGLIDHSVDIENQADCVAGSWIGYVNAAGQLEPGDIDEINVMLQVIAAAEEAGRTHGTLEERTASANLGASSGIGACNTFFPGNPLIA